MESGLRKEKDIGSNGRVVMALVRPLDTDMMGKFVKHLGDVGGEQWEVQFDGDI